MVKISRETQGAVQEEPMEVLAPLVQAIEDAEEKAAKKPQEKKGRGFEEIKADVKADAEKSGKAGLRGTSGSSSKKKQATEDDVDVALGQADPEKWDALELAAMPKKVNVYRGSLVGQCVTALVALQLKDALGLDVSESLPLNVMPAAEAGTRMEPHIIEKFCADYGYRKATYGELAKMKEEGTIAGYNPEMEQIQVWKMIGKKIMLRSHPDSFVTPLAGEDAGVFYDLEVKYLGPDLYKKLVTGGLDKMGDIGEKYAWQVSARMGSHGLPLIFVGAEKLGGNDEGSSEIGELDVTVFDKAPVKWKKIIGKLIEVQGYVKEGVLPDECGKGTYGCPAFRLSQCGNPDAAVRVEETLDDTELGHLLALQFAYNTDKKDAEKALEPVKAQIKKLMEARYPNAEGFKYTVKDEAGNTFKYEWQVIEQPEKVVAGYTSRWGKITLIGKAEEAK